MRGLQKSKRVSWASDLDLCQVKLFLSEESPSQVGINSQDHLQAKTSLLLHAGGAGSDDILPPGFEGTHASSQFEITLSQIPVIKWINPPKIVLNLTWQVVAGEESKEVEDQHKREMRVLEAIYPRVSSIPPNPSVSMDVEDSHFIDDQTALIPITPIEDEDAAADALSDSLDVSQSRELTPGILKGSNSATNMQLARGLVSDVAAASVALTNIVKSNEHGNLIDHELLNNILNNPEVIEKLVRDYGVTNNSQYVHNVGSISSSVAFSHPPIPINQGETTTPSSVAFSATSSYTPPTVGQVGPVSTQWLPRPAVSSVIVSSPVEVPSTKDANYYKSLIQQHGGDKQETLAYSSNHTTQQPITNYETAYHRRTKVSKPKIMKPCIFFNSSRGCRNGANCAYQHDASFQPRGGSVTGLQNSKRMKMDNEISS
ncbi:zinc finger CCCH domain-containing protein 6 [Gastrolobium bilobum]|uniref:zinc finger CCCH domain-containing protein 6 n=1 Tax=Gastrolobium bilobum TaxID=150636 RepID=UPI002AB126EF|nr:zinc finger CCCH domain-containing protein 6 [Gastrolobium bilobum]